MNGVSEAFAIGLALGLIIGSLVFVPLGIYLEKKVR
jgi:hypothetical protein